MFSLDASLTDSARLAEVTRYDHTHSLLIAQLDDLAARSATWTGMPISLVTLITDTTQLCVGMHGLPDTVTVAGRTFGRFDLPVQGALCAPMIASGHSHIVPDLRKDPRYAQHPLVTELGLRSYVGVPLISLTGRPLGGHCVLDFQPRPADVTDVLALELGAADALAQLEARCEPGLLTRSRRSARAEWLSLQAAFRLAAYDASRVTRSSSGAGGAEQRQANSRTSVETLG